MTAAEAQSLLPGEQVEVWRRGRWWSARVRHSSADPNRAAVVRLAGRVRVYLEEGPTPAELDELRWPDGTAPELVERRPDLDEAPVQRARTVRAPSGRRHRGVESGGGED